MADTPSNVAPDTIGLLPVSEEVGERLSYTSVSPDRRAGILAAMPRLQTNTLYYGDNLPVVREYIPDESVDLIYLDPPFNSKQNYNVLFKETAVASPAQTGAFEDTWHWGDAAREAQHEISMTAPDQTARMLNSMADGLANSDMAAYLTMMTIRLLELKRVLKSTGSIYLHCDPTASHYLKVIMDSIFGPETFISEIVWKRTSTHNSAKRYAPIHDVLLMYGKNRQAPLERQLHGAG